MSTRTSPPEKISFSWAWAGYHAQLRGDCLNLPQLLSPISAAAPPVTFPLALICKGYFRSPSCLPSICWAVDIWLNSLFSVPAWHMYIFFVRHSVFEILASCWRNIWDDLCLCTRLELLLREKANTYVRSRADCFAIFLRKDAFCAHLSTWLAAIRDRNSRG